MSNTGSRLDFVQTTCNYPSNTVPWWNPGGLHIMLHPPTANLCTNVSPRVSNYSKAVEHQILECDSSSVQSSGDSHHTLSERSDDHCSGHGLSAQSGAVHEKANGKGDEQMHEIRNDGNDAKQALSAGCTQVFYAPPKIEYGQSPAFVPYAYSDAQYAGLVSVYGSHNVIHPQMSSILPGSRLALPLQPTGEEPIYVNAKQYRAILRRREHRAKLESQNKVVKIRKPYLHESRHVHAMKRARGTGGRFLNTKKLEKQRPRFSTSVECAHGSEVIQTATSCSEETTGSSLSGVALVGNEPRTDPVTVGSTIVIRDRHERLFGDGAMLRVPVTR